MLGRVSGLVAVGSVLLAGCTNTPGVSLATPTASPTPARPAIIVAATPSPSPEAKALVVEHVGASASPTGFFAFALLSNPSTQAAADVKIDITSVDSSGRVLARGSGTIRQIDPGHKQALAVRIAMTRILPTAFRGTVSGNRWLEAGNAADPTEVMSAVFVQDPRTPSVRVRIANHASQPERAAITAICFDDSGQLRGGGTTSAHLPASAGGQDAWVAVSIPVVPASCEAYALAK
ncbi:MAG: hypothetical protein M3077_12520 [Candidatus Dormibacteraeota bacterium]|nr:hypothetical protein [Candidatus Dormibacteraeota bacterium]